MVDDVQKLSDIQKSVVKENSKGRWIKGYHDFVTCRKSYFKRPVLVILSNGFSYFEGFTTCDKVFYCANCHRSYLYEKNQKLARVEEYIKHEGLFPVLITLHIPHHAKDKLKPLRIKLHKATVGLISTSGKNQNKLMRKINNAVGSKGYVLRNDVTFGDNGWNPHVHILSLNKVGYSEQEKNRIVDEYAHQLELAGFNFSRFNRYCKSNLVHFRENSCNTSYIGKCNDDLMNLAVTNQDKYLELVESCTNDLRIPLIRFKNGLLSKVDKVLGSPIKSSALNEFRRVEVPEHLLRHDLPLEEIKNLCLESIKY